MSAQRLVTLKGAFGIKNGFAQYGFNTRCACCLLKLEVSHCCTYMYDSHVNSGAN